MNVYKWLLHKRYDLIRTYYPAIISTPLLTT